VTMKNAVFWEMTPCASCMNRRFGGTYHLQFEGTKNHRARSNVSNRFLLEPHGVTTQKTVFFKIKMLLRNEVRDCVLDSSDLEYGLLACSCVFGRELSVSVKCWTFPDYQILKGSESDL
jgi:hypothetical protein